MRERYIERDRERERYIERERERDKECPPPPGLLRHDGVHRS